MFLTYLEDQDFVMIFLKVCKTLCFDFLISRITIFIFMICLLWCVIALL
ncbi:hypothetical protein HanRHA438_Chr08g0327551 [Helianthus annuus]|nr:hypothetical protein HanRHA438_Chr08g0327551 [Helianthus annuus]